MVIAANLAPQNSLDQRTIPFIGLKICMFLTNKTRKQPSATNNDNRQLLSLTINKNRRINFMTAIF